MQPTAATPDDLAWLVSNEAADLLAAAAQFTGELTTRITRLRALTTPPRAALVLEQVELRRRAAEKFSAAERMFFTRTALEQATDETLARYKALRFADHPRRFDLCCGIGGDLLALGATGTAIGFDRDPASAIFAAANARALNLPGVEVRQQDVTALDLSACDAWHLDPDRRPQGRRTTRVELHEPSAAVMDTLLARNTAAAIKLAPAAELPPAWSAAAECEWISRARQCRQLVAWFGALAGDRGLRRATVLRSAGEPASFVGVPGQLVPLAATLSTYLFEPDAAVLAARLDGALAQSLDLRGIAAGVAYWTGAKPIDSPLCTVFEVLEVLPLDVKRLRAALRTVDAGTLEIKVRGVDEDPARWRHKLNPAGTTPITLFLARLSDARRCAIIARRMPS